MDLPFLRKGSGKPLVLVHGYLGGSAQWADQIAAFAASHDVIAPDLPGFGAAAALPGPKRISDFSDAVMHCLDSLEIGRFTLLGHSMGGMIVQDITARHADRIDGLVLYGTGPLGLMPDRFESVETSMARLESDGLRTTADRISAMWFRDGASGQGYVPTRDIARMANPNAARNALMAMRDWDGRGTLKLLPIRSRIIWGDQDRSYRWPQINALWNGISGVELSVIPGASHAAHMEKTDIFNALVRDFLQ